MSSRRTWTPDDSATLRRMARAGYSDGEIAQHLGFCRETVTRRRLCLGYTAGPKTGRRRRFIRDLQPGKTMRPVSNSFTYGLGLYSGYDGYEIIPNDWERALLEITGITDLIRGAQSA
jgi:hypothetical protein